MKNTTPVWLSDLILKINKSQRIERMAEIFNSIRCHMVSIPLESADKDAVIEWCSENGADYHYIGECHVLFIEDDFVASQATLIFDEATMWRKGE